MRTIIAGSLLCSLILAACNETGSSTPTSEALVPATSLGSPAPTSVSPAVSLTRPLRLVVMGDGYTIGASTAAPNRDSWPAQLQSVTRRGDMRVRVVRNLGASGQTSEDVLLDQLPQVESYQPDVVTVQVGVNDIFTGVPVDQYGANVEAILDGLLEFLRPERIFVITTPDHELTERGRELGPYGSGSDDVEALNSTLAAAAAARGIAVIDIAPVYDLVVEDPSMVIDGGPDPSARQYAGWVELIGQHIRRSLAASEP